MAALRMESRSDQRAEVTRLGHRVINTTVHSWRTFVYVSVQKDGTVTVLVERDDRRILDAVIWPETGDNGEAPTRISCLPVGEATVIQDPFTGAK